jgi:hypothetical protein
MRIKLGNIKVHEAILVSYHGKIKCKWEKLKHMKKSLNAIVLIYKLEKVYITPSPMGLDYITAQLMKLSISPLELCKTGQITPYCSFEKSH